MAYVHKLINDDEKLIGIARLHWIYVVQGLLWFLAMAAAGYAMSWLMSSGLAATMRMVGNAYIPSSLMTLSNGVMMFMLVTGAIIFMMYVIKVLCTQVALTDRRIIHKYGLLFVNVHQIDVEEIRGENLDLGYFGRILGYGTIMLDCRFIGDVRLPAIERPEAFLRALHDRRAHAQDTLSLVAGKSNTAVPVNLVEAGETGDDTKTPPTPEITPPKPEPEVSPTPPDQIPVPPNQPMPDAPPPLSEAKTSDKASQASGFDKFLPEISARIEKVKDEMIADMTRTQSDDIVPPKSLEDIRAEGKAEPLLDVHKTQKETQEAHAAEAAPAPETKRVLTKQEIAQVVEEITPQIAQEVVKEMQREGLIKPQSSPMNDNDIDNLLIKDFDEAAFDKDGPNYDNNARLERTIN